MRRLLSLFFIFITAWLSAQDVSVTVDCPRVVVVGETFRLDVAVNAQSSQPKFSDMPTFKILRNMGTSQGFQSYMSGGKMVSSVSVTYSYAVQATAEGTHEIPPVEVTSDGKTYRSNPVQVQVVSTTAQAKQQTQQGAIPPQAESGEQANTESRDLFASVLPDRTKLYQGEYLNATLKIYSKLNLSSINNLKLSSFDGFYKQDVPTPQLHSLTRENINGEVYGTGVLGQFVLFPQKSGTLVISPATMEVGVTQQVRSRSMFDDFWGGSVQVVPRQISTREVHITVLPLPEGKPASFINAVGQFKFTIAANKTEVKANDAVTLKLVISGTGNIKFADAPRINFPPDFETYDPKITVNLNEAATAGSKTYEFLIVPRHEGVYKLPAVAFSWFDPQEKRYKTISSDEIILNVDKGNDPADAVMSGVTQEDVKFLGQDVRYIKPVVQLRRTGDLFFGSCRFLLWYALPTLLFVSIVYFRRKYIRKYADTAMMKNRRASRHAARRLKRARTCIAAGQPAQMYEELARALWGYLSDKLNIPPADLSKDNGKIAMQQHNVPESVADEFIAVINDCEYARYAPSAGSADMKTLYERAAEVIHKIELKIER
jgi:hypothetical protein